MAVRRKPSRQRIAPKSSSKTKPKHRPSASTDSPVARTKQTRPTEIYSDQAGFPIVGIGASAGGLEALEEFFRHMSPDSGMAFVVVSHQPTGRTSLLPGLLMQCTTMPLLEVTDGITVEPNHVYLAPAGKNLALLQGVFHLMELDQRDRVPLPIDYFFRSLAEDQKHKVIGIILSGTGTDGTLGLKAIKGESGMTMAQEVESAKYGGMPRSAIAAGAIDVIRPVAHMPGQLIAYAKGLFKTTPISDLASTELDRAEILQKLFVLLRDRTGCDFSLYKANTSSRRIERRMNVHQIEDLGQYVRFLQSNQEEIDALFHELLIGVTSFFRDRQAFEVFEQKGLPFLFDDKADGAPLRIWVTGCSTGEEAYSLAILLREFLMERKSRRRVEIFATDIDGQAIATARTGLYPAGISDDITPVRLQRFFTKEDGWYRVKKEIRDLVIFAVHNLLTDPPFTKLNLVSCRNTLIYLETKAQQNLLATFHYALKPKGLLWLGPSETNSGFEERFMSVDKKWKLFTRDATSGVLPYLERFAIGLTHTGVDTVPIGDVDRRAAARKVPALVEQLLMGRYVPASVVADTQGEVVYIHGHTGAYLEPAPGPQPQHLLDMAREGLKHELSAMLQQAAGRQTEIVRRGIRVRANGAVNVVTVTVRRIAEPDSLQGLFWVIFEPVPAARKQEESRSTPSVRKVQTGLHRELEETKQRLQHTIEEVQTSNEELKSANEELQSTNEELQSTNEELETAKEELQSLNEELVTVNAELQGKLDELSGVNDDLTNLLNSTEVATIFVDNLLCIKRFTPEAKKVVNLIVSDVGRPLSDISSRIVSDQILEDTRDVLDTLIFKEREVQTTDGIWYFMRIFPYRTAKNTIEGLVLTFLNITKMKRAEQTSQAALDSAQNIVETIGVPLLVLDEELRALSANQSFYETFHLTAQKTEQQLIYNVGNGMFNIQKLRQLLEEILPHDASFEDFMIDQDFPAIGRRVLALKAWRLRPESTLPARILLVLEDITDRQRSKES
ncbi:MAG: PAS domain-containing protein [Nitrospira sp.]|nr:PAS domain-containing protein [Nitrospira sp.]